MPVSAPADTSLVLRALLLNQTSAGTRVSNDLPQDPTWPHLIYAIEDASRTPGDLRRAKVEFRLDSWGGPGGRSIAKALAREAQDRLFPNIVKGFHGNVTLPDLSQVFVWDIQQVLGYSDQPDLETGYARFISRYVIIHE